MLVKPVLFNTEMVRAILDGRKSCTRRIAKPQPDWNHTYPLGFVNDSTERKDVGSFGFGTNELGGSIHYAKPPYQPGDILYVRETWKCWRAHRYEATADIIFKTGGDGVRLQFANGSIDSVNRFDYDTFVNKWLSYHGEWKPAIHMPKEAARIWLKVTDVRVERLQEISGKDLIKEGIDLFQSNYVRVAFDEFKNIWNSTIKKSDLDRYGWDANPWVWVVEFERCEKPEDNQN
jgi:hypothetical protein